MKIHIHVYLYILMAETLLCILASYCEEREEEWGERRGLLKGTGGRRGTEGREGSERRRKGTEKQGKGIPLSQDE